MSPVGPSYYNYYHYARDGTRGLVVPVDQLDGCALRAVGVLCNARELDQSLDSTHTVAVVEPDRDGPARGRTRGTTLLDSAGALSTLVCTDAGGIAFWIVHVTAIAAVAVLGNVDAGGVGSESRVGLVGWIGKSETTSSAAVGQVQEKRWRFHVHLHLHLHLHLHGWHSFDTVFPNRCSASGQPQSTLVARHSAPRTGLCLVQFCGRASKRSNSNHTIMRIGGWRQTFL